MYGEAFEITFVILITSVLLSVVITSDFAITRRESTFFWGIGIWIFSVATLIEVLFSLSYYSMELAYLYIFLVAFLVQMLATGSLFLVKSSRYVMAYVLYSAIADAFLVYSLVVSTTGSLITNGVFNGSLPVMVTAGSSLVTFLAVIILIVVSLLSYLRIRNLKLISIILGVIVLSASGSLYIASFPAFLYIGNLIGLTLLWAGFVDFASIYNITGVKKHVNG
jgi:hypothetical protein